MILYEKGSTTTNASGTTFTLQDTSNERKLSFKKYYGNTTQETQTDGKNLFNNVITSSSSCSSTPLNTGIRVTITSAGTYRYLYQVLGANELLGKTITLYSKITPSASNTGYLAIWFGKAGSSAAVQKIGVMATTGSLTVTIPSSFPSGTDKIYLLLYGNLVGTGNVGDYVDYTNLQVEIGSQPTSYEPYTHGPTPNPHFPQPINVVTGGNTISVVGKNLFSGFTKGYGLNSTNGSIISS